MARLPDFRRIDKSDFEKSAQATVDKLAFVLNSFMEQTRNALDRNLDFTNLNQQLVTLTVTVDAMGVPLQPTQYKSTLKTQVAGHNCINSVNLTTPQNYPTSNPNIIFTSNEKLVTILNITGLQANERYQLTILSIGK